jgi:hypothetical protein
MISSTKRRLARGIGAGLAAVAAFGTLGVSAASASSGPAPLAGITVPGDPPPHLPPWSRAWRAATR